MVTYEIKFSNLIFEECEGKNDSELLAFIGTLKTGDLLQLGRNIFNGLKRNAIVEQVGLYCGTFTVRHTIDPDMVSKIPKVVYASTIEGIDVPFPIVYAFRPIPQYTELLVYYNDVEDIENTPRGHEPPFSDAIFGIA